MISGCFVVIDANKLLYQIMSKKNEGVHRSTISVSLWYFYEPSVLYKKFLLKMLNVFIALNTNFFTNDKVKDIGYIISRDYTN